VVQYHFQPSDESAATVPIGYITCDPQRVAHIDSFLNSRLFGRGEGHVVWSEDSERDIANYMEKDRLELIQSNGLGLPMSSQVKLTIKKQPRKL